MTPKGKEEKKWSKEKRKKKKKMCERTKFVPLMVSSAPPMVSPSVGVMAVTAGSVYRVSSVAGGTGATPDSVVSTMGMLIPWPMGARQ
jgi:glutamate synthase domain-containing protein 2